MTTYWSAIVHDFQHGGLNNDFLIKTAHSIALTYNDQSPLENHHLAQAFAVFLDPKCQYVRVSLPGLIAAASLQAQASASTPMPEGLFSVCTARPVQT